MSPILFVLFACTGDLSTDPPPTELPPPPVAEDPTREPPPLDKAALTGAAREATLVPSPTEMQRALAEAGIDKGLSALVPVHRTPLPGDDRDVIAVRVGMDLAYTLLTVTDAETPKLVERMLQVKAGAAALDAGSDLGSTIDDLVGRLQSDALSRQDLLSELDEMHGAVLPEIEFEAGERAVPLIQAGSWLAGVNLVATAVGKANRPEAARLLKQPEVAAHFLQYVRTEGADKAPAAVMKKLEETLIHLQAVAKQPELTLEDVRRIEQQTGDVLALL